MHAIKKPIMSLQELLSEPIQKAVEQLGAPDRRLEASKTMSFTTRVALFLHLAILVGHHAA